MSMKEYSYVVNIDGIVVNDNKYLLIERGADEEHASGALAFPGGKLEAEPGSQNAIENTVSREIHEEVGVTIGDIQYLHSNTFETEDNTSCINIVMLCEYAGGDAHPRAKDEVAGVHWMSYDEIKSHDDVPSFTERFADVAEKNRTQQDGSGDSQNGDGFHRRD
ncbi:mutT/NUDIX family protein [Haloarcula argentinensis DSM 12282]|nr:mutT/NUDIX family protein [Haloarcula argentinensis DSM 12282]